MALTCGFYNSVDGDRKYDATQFASLFDGVITDGVVAAVGDFFATTPGGGMVVNVGTGRAWFNRTWTYSDAKIPLTLDASDLLYDRIDAVVLEIDTSIAVRDNSIKVIKGTPAQEPQKPVLTNEGDVHQYALAYVRVKASSIEVGEGDITINVGQVDCPFVTSIVDTPELDVLFAQWDAQFTAWFENVQSQLEGDVAANLQRQIDLKANKVDVGDFETPAKKLGLTGDLSVGASLGVLATVGDLHVWRRTVSSLDGKPETPAGYKLGAVQSGKFTLNSINAEAIYFTYADDVSVSSQGTVSIGQTNRGIATVYGGDTVEAQKLVGKFIQATRTSGSQWTSDLTQNEIYFIPTDAEVTKYNNRQTYVSKYQTVTGYPYQPAVPPGTVTVDYPVSVNPNAYQTGSDAKPAGYKLGKVVNGTRKFAGWNTANSSIASTKYSSSVSVDPDGTVRLKNPTTWQVETSAQGALSASTTFRGKFFIIENNGNGGTDLNRDVVYFCPADANFGYVSRIPSYLTIDKYQPVTGYPAIPASTTIEYLGKLGGKSRMQIVSYVGTGRYGSGNPCSINADFPIRLLTFLGQLSASGSGTWSENAGQYASNNVLPALLTKTPQSGIGFSVTSRSTCTTYASKDKKTVIWYNSSASLQLNESGREYYFLCQG